jgi:hypothetical protein
MWQLGTVNRKCRCYARVYPEQENEVILPLLPLELWAPCKARWVWASALVFSSATCALQFAKASAATLSKQGKNDSADVQRGEANISGFICTVLSSSTRQRTFDEFESINEAMRRAHRHWRIFLPWRLRHKTRRGPQVALSGADVWR